MSAAVLTEPYQLTFFIASVRHLSAVRLKILVSVRSCSLLWLYASRNYHLVRLDVVHLPMMTCARSPGISLMLWPDTESSIIMLRPRWPTNPSCSISAIADKPWIDHRVTWVTRRKRLSPTICDHRCAPPSRAMQRAPMSVSINGIRHLGCQSRTLAVNKDAREFVLAGLEKCLVHNHLQSNTFVTLTNRRS
jgi:hypothetical protein